MIENPISLENYIQKFNKKIKYKTLITAVSYENRGFLSVKSIVENLDVEKVILILYTGEYLNDELKERWEKQRIMLNNFFRNKRINFTELECDPVLFKKSIEEIKSITNNQFSNIINITTFPKNYIIRLAKEFDDSNNIFFYSKSDYRKPNENELKIGVGKIIPIEGFEGTRELNSEDLLVLVLGFEGNRALSFVSKFSPFKILPLISIPKKNNEVDEKFYEDVKECNRLLLRKHRILKSKNGLFFRVSSLNHLDFASELNNIIKEYKREGVDICVSSLGTKPQALGMYLYWKEHKDTQILYSVPSKRIDITCIENKTVTSETNDTNIEHENNNWIYRLPPN
ncbi:MAG: hypothetical protein QM426_11320 [Euryarchaeota archaeon]|nr:hypothetical protein [Euryarchaeota archaeon]